MVVLHGIVLTRAKILMLKIGTERIELSRKSPSVSPLISSAFGPYPLFQWYPQSKEILLNLGMKG